MLETEVRYVAFNFNLRCYSVGTNLRLPTSIVGIVRIRLDSLKAGQCRLTYQTRVETAWN